MSSGSNLLTYSLLVNQYREYCFFRSDDLGSVPLHSVHGGINPPSKIPPPLSCQAPPLKSTNCPSPPFFWQGPPPPPLYLFFVPPLCICFSWTSSPKSQIFQWTPEILKFASLIPSHLLKVSKFLGKICHYEFVVMTEKNIFADKLFVIKYFRFQILFLCENCTPPEKSHSPLSQQPPSKGWPVKLVPPFWKFGRRFNPPPPPPPPQQKGWVRGCTLCSSDTRNAHWTFRDHSFRTYAQVCVRVRIRG